MKFLRDLPVGTIISDQDDVPHKVIDNKDYGYVVMKNMENGKHYNWSADSQFAMYRLPTRKIRIKS